MAHLIRLFMIMAGVGLTISLWNSDVTFESGGGWYLVGLALILGVSFSGECFVFFVLWGGLVLAHTLFWESPRLLGMDWRGAVLCFVLAMILHALDAPVYVRRVKCPSCFWHGLETSTHLGRCPICGSRNLREIDRDIPSHA